MDDAYEACIQNLKKLAEWYRQNEGDRNEATTRMHLIDTLFMDCLGWEKNDVIAEEQEDGERTDYLFSAPRRALVVEAKREGKYFELPPGTKKEIHFSLRGLCRDHSDVKDALEQVASYCQHRGAPFGAVCNGHQIIAFVASRQDGVSPMEGKGIVFDSFDLMISRFFDLWKVLSKPGVEDKKLYEEVIGTGHVVQVPRKLSATITDYPGVKGRNVLQVNLKILSDLVLEDAPRAPEFEERFLKDCYCRSGALSQNSMLAKNILRARYAELFDKTMGHPTLVPATTKKGANPDVLVESVGRRPILLLGDVGVGKTMFMRHLIKVEAQDLLKDHIVLTIDLGSQVALAMDMRKAILKLTEDQLREDYRIDVEDGAFVRKVYRRELARFEKGIYKDVKNTQPNLFAEKELAFLETKLEARDGHVKSCLEHVTRDSNKQVLFFLDNVDQRGEQGVQEQAFLIAQEIAGSWPAMVFLALRPETYHRSYKNGGSLSGYHPKAFTISPPRIDRVLEKRLKFASLVCTGRIPIERLKSTTIQLAALTVVIKSFIQTMEWKDEIVEFIDNITGGNVRLALDLVRDFFGSGHIDTKKIVEKYNLSGHYYVGLHEFLRTVTFGDYNYYDPTKSCITNVFDISSLDPKEHFLVPALVMVVHNEGRKVEEHGFVEVGRVYESLHSIGFTADQIDKAVVKTCRNKLLESGARHSPEMGQVMPRLLRATSIGIYHVHHLVRMFSYVDAMIVDTPILDDEVRDKTTDVEDVMERLERAERFRQYLNTQWKTFDRRGIELDWSGVSKDLAADIAMVMKMNAEERKHGKRQSSRKS